MLEYFGAAAGLLYIYLEIKQRRSVWLVGIITAAVYVFVFFSSKVYANMGLNLYYVFISLYGLRQWSRNRPAAESGETILYRHIDKPALLSVALAWGMVFAVTYCLLSRYTGSTVPLGDAFTAAGGVVATWMLARRIIEHWYIWIVSDLVSVYLCFLLKLYPSMFLYFCYAAMAGVGYHIWKRKGERTDGNRSL
jgi:nicotinamide mononucleotide transporter